MWSYRSPFVTLAAFSCMVWSTVAANPYSWQEPHSMVKMTGHLEWAPRPFVFEQGTSVRYVDFERGDDTRAGTTKDQAVHDIIFQNRKTFLHPLRSSQEERKECGNKKRGMAHPCRAGCICELI